MQLNNPVDIAQQIAAAAAPLTVAAAPAVADPVAITGLTPVATPVVDTAAILAAAATSGLVIVGADPLAVAVTATATDGSTVPEATVPAPVPLTRAEQLKKTIEQSIIKRDAAIKAIANAESQLGSIDKLDSIVSGSKVLVQLGRAETSRQVEGTVTGIKTETTGAKKFKVLVGEGFDATTEVVNEGQILSVK